MWLSNARVVQGGWIFGVLLLAMLLMSCMSAPASPLAEVETVVTNTPAPTMERVTQAETLADQDRLVLGLGRNLYYGTSQWVFLHGSLGVWEPLVILDNDMLVRPVLATSWEPNADGTEWVFHLREGVRFHDGTPFNAEAVLLNVPALQEEYDRTLPHLDRVEALDDYTVNFILKESTPNLPQLIAYFSSAMLSPSALDQDGWPAEPIGTGPFRFVEYITDDSIILEANQDYWDGRPKLRQVVFKYIPDATTRLAALRTGEIDAIADVGSLQPEQASIVTGNPDLVLLQQGVATSHYLTFNSGKPPFDDRRLRQAVSMMIDRQLLVDTTLHGFGQPGVSVITPHARQWVRTDIAPHYDPEAARALAQEVLAGERVEVRLVLNSAFLGRWPYENISQITQSSLRDIGIELTIEKLEGGAWNEALKNGEYDVTMMPYTLMTGDPDFFMSPWVWSEGNLNTRRSYGYSNPHADALILAAISEMDVQRRKEYYDELQAIVAEDVPFTPLYHEVTIYATRNSVKDLFLDVQFKPSLEQAYIVAQ